MALLELKCLKIVFVNRYIMFSYIGYAMCVRVSYMCTCCNLFDRSLPIMHVRLSDVIAGT